MSACSTSCSSWAQTSAACSAARAHSRLRKAVFTTQQHPSTFLAATGDPHTHSVLLYLSKSHQQITSMILQGKSEPAYLLESLPRCGALQQLSITEGYLQLFPTPGAQGLLAAVPNLTQLSLCGCSCQDELEDIDKAAAAATSAAAVAVARAGSAGSAAAALAAAGARGTPAAPRSGVRRFLASATGRQAVAAVRVISQLQHVSVTWQQWQHCPLDLLQSNVLNHLTSVTQLTLCRPGWDDCTSAAAMSKMRCRR